MRNSLQYAFMKGKSKALGARSASSSESRVAFFSSPVALWLSSATTWQTKWGKR